MSYEIPYIKQYIEYASNTNISLKDVKEVFDNLEKGNGNPDYFDSQSSTIIEVKRVYDQNELEKASKWNTASSNLKREIKKLPNYNNISGFYSIFSDFFGKKPAVIKRMATKLLDAIITSSEEADVEGVRFRIHKIDDEVSDISFSASSHPKWFSSEGTVTKNLNSSVLKANQQLENFKKQQHGKKGVLLLVNRYILGAKESTYIASLYQMYNDIKACKYIDEIWIFFGQEDNPGDPILLYSESFDLALAEKRQSEYSKFIELFQLSFYDRFKRDSLKESLFDFYSFVSNGKFLSQVFDMKKYGEDFIEIGHWLAKQERYEECCLFIKGYLSDSSLNQYIDESLNRNISNGEEVSHVTSALGRLAFVIQKLAFSKEYYCKGIDFTKSLLDNPNSYIQYQGCIPLIELSAKARFVDQTEKSGLKNLLFETIRKLGGNRVIASRLIDCCGFFREFTEEEAEELLSILGNYPHSGSIHVIYDLCWSTPLITDENKARYSNLKNKLANPKFDSSIKNKIIWTLGRALTDEKDDENFQFLSNQIVPLLEAVLDLEFSKETHGNFMWIMDKLVHRNPELVASWYLKTTKNWYQHLKEEMPNGLVYHSSDLLPTCAEYLEDSKLVELLNCLRDMWLLGVHIGNPAEIFSNCLIAINDVEKRNKIASQIDEIYKLMREKQPNLPDHEFH